MKNNKLNDYFFTFDSDNFDKIETKLYGYSITKHGGKITISNSTNGIIGGCYILIEKTEDKITIKQDDLSSLYLYYYTENGYWAIGNSFYDLCRLLVSRGKKLTIRDLYIDQYIHQPLHVYSCNRSMVNEIKIMKCFSEMQLTRNTLNIIEKNAEFESIDIFTKEGIGLIDNWIDKWCCVIKSVCDNDINTQIDLSGGFDSRTIFSLANYAGVDFNKSNVNVYSKIGKTRGMIEHLEDDYQIAEKISEKLNFILNLRNDIFATNVSKTTVAHNMKY